MEGLLCYSLYSHPARRSAGNMLAGNTPDAQVLRSQYPSRRVLGVDRNDDMHIP